MIAVNSGLEVRGIEGARSYKVRRAVEADLHWATLRFIALKGAGRRVSGAVEGVPEDFTLSRLGVRLGRALLSGELVWHPILGRGLATWGTRGHVRRYQVHVEASPGDVAGPGEAEHTGDGVVFRGEPRLRNPGLTVIGGVRAWELGGARIASARPDKAGSREALALLETLNDALARAGEALGIPTPEYRAAALVWDDVEPFACDDLVAARVSVARALARGSPLAAYEAVYTAAVHTAYNAPLEALDDYWLYEALPGILSLYILSKSLGEEAVNAARSKLAQCVEATGGRSRLPPPARVGVPKNPGQHASVSCLAPLLVWESAGPEGAGALAGCVVGRGSVSGESLRACAEEHLGEAAPRVLGALYGGIRA